MTATPANFLRNIWYYAMPSVTLKCGRMTSKIILDEPILFCRDNSGNVFALRDVCPHRGVPLSDGHFDGDQVECCYHGWRFDGQGKCTCIPALVGHEGIEPENIRVRSFKVVEQQGGIWIYIQDLQHQTADYPAVPFVMNVGKNEQPFVCEQMVFPCNIDHAVVGLMDPAHGPFVHASWWWRGRKSIHEKAKIFAPSYLGFTMLRHKPSQNSFAYKLLGGSPETEISFQLPGIRIEQINVGRHVVGNLTCVTPISATETEITHSIYTSISWLKFIQPIVKIFAIRFLNQDKRVVVMQQQGLKYEQNLLLIRDADTQARWYYQLKNEYIRALAEARAFVNPIKEVVLRWRS